MNEDRLLRLALFLDTLPDKLFDFRRWVTPGVLPPMQALERGGGCGTTACAVGWLPAIFPDQWRWDTTEGGCQVANGVRLIGTVGTLGWCQQLADAQAFFDIGYGQASFLFTPHDCDDEEDCEEGVPHEDASPKEVAQHIRDFVANGGAY